MLQIRLEIDGDFNECLFFRPLQRRLRGRFDLNRVAEPNARMKVRDWPDPIPGKILGIEMDKCTADGFIREPLHEPEYSLTREKIEAGGVKLPPEQERFENVHAGTWLFWMQRAVQGGLAKVVSGAFPDKLEKFGVPEKSFITRTAPDRRDALIEKLIGLVYATLPADKKRELAELVDA